MNGEAEDSQPAAQSPCASSAMPELPQLLLGRVLLHCLSELKKSACMNEAIFDPVFLPTLQLLWNKKLVVIPVSVWSRARANRPWCCWEVV